MSLHPRHGVLFTFVFLFLTRQRASSYYFVHESRRNWRGGLDVCGQYGMKYLDPRSPEAAEKASRYLGIFRDSSCWSGLQFERSTESFRLEGSQRRVQISELEWGKGEPDLASNHECTSFTFVENKAVFKMANCSQTKTVACEGKELKEPDRFRSFSKGKKQTEFCEPNHAGSPVCTFYQGHDSEIELLEVDSAEAVEDCALLCMGMDECVHFNYIRKSAISGRCLIHRLFGQSKEPEQPGEPGQRGEPGQPAPAGQSA